jgi:hypothetical protein
MKMNQDPSNNIAATVPKLLKMRLRCGLDAS